jgi:hypothetical protein
MAIALADHPVLRRLKRENVETTLAGLKIFMKDARWIGAGNRYAIDTVRTLVAEIDAGAIQSPSQLSEYIAASCLLHCGDGWSYLGRAIWALLKGDPHRARHLAYYAELRAATALLATEGIGVFNNEHFAITAPNRASQLSTRKGTHHFAWDCLEFWAAEPSCANLFAQVISPYGESLENWCVTLGGVSTLAPHARNWFMQWGMDLQMFPHDQRARNISSYQPDGVPRVWALDGHDTINFVRSLWEALEPAANSRFDAIDRHILRLSLEKHFAGRNGRPAAKDRQKYLKFIKPIVEGHGLSDDINKQWIQFLNREINPQDMEIFTYSRKIPDDMSYSAFAIMSRATLLLRAASGSTSKLFQAANHSIDSFKFWWEKFGISRGLWHGQRDANELQDLWIDIRDSLTEIEEFQQKNSKDNQTFFRLGEDVAKAVAALSSCERVALWSMTT